MDDALLGLMLASYAWPIIFVSREYVRNKNNSVSEIVMFKPHVIVFMIAMGIFTILYEIYRKDYISLAWICALLVGIIGLCVTQSYMHFVMAALAFIAIVGFMIHHCLKNGSKSQILWILLTAQLIASVVLAVCVYRGRDIFKIEAFCIINFAVFYIYLHFICKNCLATQPEAHV
jgi:hypothetical protein